MTDPIAFFTHSFKPFLFVHIYKRIYTHMDKESERENMAGKQLPFAIFMCVC